MKALNFLFATGCFSCALACWLSGFYYQAGMLWCLAVLYVKCGLDIRDNE